MREELGIQHVESRGPKSADHLAAGLNPQSLKELEASNQEVEHNLGISAGWEAQEGCQM